MNREEFLRRLEELLQDISEEEKRDALDYYRSYLEEAGPQREAEVLAGFGSPEQVAASIRASLGGGAAQGEFTDCGYREEEAEPFKRPAVVAGKAGKEAGQNRGQASEEAGGEESKGKRSGCGNGCGRKTGGADAAGRPEKKETKWWMYVLVGMILVIAAPLLLSAFFGTLGSLIGLVFALLAALAFLGLVTLAALFAGVGLIFAGGFQLFSSVWGGLLLLGSGMACAGGGLLLLYCCYLFYGRFLPWLCRAVWRLISRGADLLAEKLG